MPDSDARLLFDAVREAGALAMAMQSQNVRRWTKSDGTPVTEADVAVDRLLHSRLQAERPSFGWLSEETPDNEARLSRETMWIADPIDGTRAFAQGGSEWCVAVALIRNGKPIAAAIYRPVADEFFTAIEGQGAKLDGNRILATEGNALSDARLVGTRKSLSSLAAHGIAADVSGTLPLQLRLAFVAAGRFDGAVSFGPKNDWDLAAGDLVVREAKGLASNLEGHAFVYNRRETWQQGMIAAGASRHAALTKALRTS